MEKVGIIGLRPRQAADLRGHKFKNIDVSCFDAKKFTLENITSFSRDMYRVVLVQTGAPKVVYGAIPKDRLVVLRNNSSISTVVRALNTLENELDYAREKSDTVEQTYMHDGEDYTQSIVDGTVVESPAPEPTPEPVAEPTPERKPVKPGLVIASEVPQGHVSQYALPKFEDEYVVSLPNSAGRQSYQILLAAVPGDILRFARPEGLPLDKWQGRIAWVRSNYWRNHSMLIEAHFYADYVDLKVMDPELEVDPVNTLNLAQPTEATAVEEKPVEAATQDEAPEETRKLHTTVVQDVEEHGLHTQRINGLSAAEMDFADEEEAATLNPVMAFVEPKPAQSMPPAFTGLHDAIFPAGVAAPEKNIIHPLKDPNLHSPVDSNPQEEVKVKASEDERMFWSKVFFHYINQAKDVSGAADQADAALTRYRKTL